MKNSILSRLFAPLHRIALSAKPVLACFVWFMGIFLCAPHLAQAAPTISGISPTSGPTSGGQRLTITGTNFTGATGVTIDGTAATNFTVVDAGTIVCGTPAHAAAANLSVVVTTGSGSNSANTLYTYYGATVVSFDSATTGIPSGFVHGGQTTFVNPDGTWALSGFLVGSHSPAFGSSPVAAATPPSDRYLDTGYTQSRAASAGGSSVGAITAPAGKTFQAVAVDIWPSRDGGDSIIPLTGSPNGVPGGTGHSFLVKGFLNNVEVVSATVVDTLRFPPQSGAIAGGYWHLLDMSNTAFATTAINKLEFFLLTQSGNYTDGPQIGSPRATPNYIALDNFVYRTGAAPASAPTVTSPTSGSITATTATLGGNITADGGASITARGVVYSRTSLNGNPQLSGANVTNLPHGTNNTGVFTVNATGLLASTQYSFAAYATNSTGTTYTTPVSTFTTNAAPVAVSSLNIVNTTPSNAGTVNWTLTFASAVTGVTSSNFSLAGATVGASVGTPSIASGGGLTWNVPVTTGADGTLTLNLANATSLSAPLSNAPFTGQSYTIDKTPPTVQSVTRLTPVGQATSNSSVTFRVTYSEEVTGVAAGRFAVVPIGGANVVGSISSVTPVSPGIYNVGVNITSGSGEFRLRVLD
jgi:hypothetical protein